MLILEAIAKQYIQQIRPKAEDELDWFRRQPSFAAAIALAARAINSKGKRYSHQRRLRKSVLSKALRVLRGNATTLRRSKDFDALFAHLSYLTEPIEGIGELYVYDTSLRLGANLGILPKRIYLHAGTRVGAKALGFTGRERSLTSAQLPREFRQLKPHEIEDVLCIFKTRLLRCKSDKSDVQLKGSWCH